MDADNEKPRPPQRASSEPSMDTDKMYADDNERPSEDEDGEPSMSPSGDGDPSMGTGDWRLPPHTRRKVVYKMMETLKRHLPLSTEEGLRVLKNIAVRFEEKIYAKATSQSDYIQKISLKMLTTQPKSHNTMANSLQSNAYESFLAELVSIFLDQSSEGNIDPKKQSSEGSSFTELGPIFLHQSSEGNIEHKKKSSEGSLLTGLVPTFLDQSSEDNIDLKKKSSEDSISPTRHANGDDWQEEVYQKIKVMKEMYLPELSEMYQRFASYLLQHNSLPQPPKSKQLDKLNFFKTKLERLISVLQISKSSISPGLKDKFVSYEKQIVNFININRSWKPVSSLQQGQLPSSRMHSMQLSQSHITRVQSHENQINPQMLLMNLQGSAATMQQNNMASLQQSSMSSLSGTAQQNMMYWLHPSYNLDSGQGNTLNSLQQFALGSLLQIPVSASQQANMNALSSQSGVSILQSISSEWTFLTASFVLEILSAACEQLSSRNKPHYAQGGLLFAIAAFLICIWDLADKVTKDRSVLRRREMLRILHYPSPRNTPCFNLADYYGLAGAVYQLFSATFEWFHVRKGVDNPIKFSIMPLVFLVLLACSRARVERYTIDGTLEDIV
ncbi:PREDICTED: mediator of RNA polymerase II transcription subunit 15a-like isoform X2 [Prunus mume]|uniref:Mediator of RNA polymerase II transcription subunit 15a-like isoform X2 n=1 Tax=Prunus mume TaxID=102107 RepID=A0ABM0N2R7_PRUMU|nr:PREDICTED: mediator of RNA polymerase II transcription subunit 15a-like isoform X2 [Prunus mume]